MDRRQARRARRQRNQPGPSYDPGYPPQRYDGPYDSQYPPRAYDPPYDPQYPPRRPDPGYDAQYAPRRADPPYDPRYPPRRDDALYPPPPQGYQRPYDTRAPDDAYHLQVQAPPSYDTTVARAPLPPSPRPTSRSAYPPSPSRSPALPPRSSSSGFTPVVIPQITRVAMKGPNASPFTRAYAPSLRAHDVSQRAFLAFLDGLNEAFLATPPARAAGTIGNLLGFVPLASAQIAGAAVQAGAGLAGAAISFVRARQFVAAANERTWHPRGLHVRVVKTPAMCEALGVPGGSLVAASGEQRGGDLREERMRPLRGYAAPLEFNVPAPAAQDDWFKKLGTWASDRTAKQQEGRLQKKRDRANKRVDRDRDRGRGGGGGGDRKMQRVLQREEKNLNGIYWVLITTKEGIADDDEGDLQERDEQEQEQAMRERERDGDGEDEDEDEYEYHDDEKHR